MKRRGRNSALSLAGPLTLVLIVAVSAIIVFYQFVYLPSAGGSEQIPEEFLFPPGSIQVLIVEGSVDINQEENYVPKEATVTLGVDNRVVWLSEDPILHTVTADPGSAEDFAEGASRSNWLDGGEEWEFIFTSPGEYNYHCEPHPWMRGTIFVVGPAAE